MELLSAIELCDICIYEDGSKASFIDIVHAFEYMLNIKFNDCYEMRRRILMRKTRKTPFLDRLVSVQTKKMDL